MRTATAADVLNAAQRLCDTWDGYTLSDLAPAITETECNALGNLLDKCGHHDAASSLYEDWIAAEIEAGEIEAGQYTFGWSGESRDDWQLIANWHYKVVDGVEMKVTP